MKLTIAADVWELMSSVVKVLLQNLSDSKAWFNKSHTENNKTSNEIEFILTDVPALNLLVQWKILIITKNNWNSCVSE